MKWSLYVLAQKKTHHYILPWGKFSNHIFGEWDSKSISWHIKQQILTFGKMFSKDNKRSFFTRHTIIHRVHKCCFFTFRKSTSYRKAGFPKLWTSTFLMYFEKFVLRYFSIFCFQFPTKAKYSSKNWVLLSWLLWCYDV